MRKEAIANLSKFKKIIKNLRIIARAQPSDKYILVLFLKSLRNVVAVICDGTNDEQAISKDNFVIAMGKVGTDTAKDASVIILLDDNFASIITLVKYGGNIFNRIRKFIQFHLLVSVLVCWLLLLLALEMKLN